MPKTSQPPKPAVRSSKLVGACERRMSRAGKLLEAAKNAEQAAKSLMHFALAEFADARRELEAAKAPTA